MGWRGVRSADYDRPCPSHRAGYRSIRRTDGMNHPKSTILDPYGPAAGLPFFERVSHADRFVYYCRTEVIGAGPAIAIWWLAPNSTHRHFAYVPPLQNIHRWKIIERELKLREKEDGLKHPWDWDIINVVIEDIEAKCADELAAAEALDQAMPPRILIDEEVKPKPLNKLLKLARKVDVEEADELQYMSRTDVRILAKDGDFNLDVRLRHILDRVKENAGSRALTKLLRKIERL